MEENYQEKLNSETVTNNSDSLKTTDNLTEESSSTKSDNKVVPKKSDNTNFENCDFEASKREKSTAEGQSTDPSSLILGKFKSTEDLSKAYRELEKLQGNQSAELGDLRNKLGFLNIINDAWKKMDTLKQDEKFLREASEKYTEYFQDPTFKEIYREAYGAFGNKLDTERLITLLESYVSSRIYAHDKLKLIEEENNKAINTMTYSKNPDSSLTPPKKRIDEMSEDEMNELLDRLI